MIKFSRYINDYFPPEGNFGMDVIRPLEAELINRLQPEEVAEMQGFNNRKRKREYLSSRLLLKEMAFDIGVDAAHFRILKDDLGKPHGYYKDNRFDISIAHTDDYVMCGLASGFEIGVDLEPADRHVSERLKSRILHAGEKQAMAELPVLRLWTIKEALIKLEGCGLRRNMNDLFVTLKDGERFFAEINNENTAEICNFLSDNHWISIAYYPEK